eukprot:2220885-Heterocapsa_arctica.AAC.1
MRSLEASQLRKGLDWPNKENTAKEDEFEANQKEMKIGRRLDYEKARLRRDRRICGMNWTTPASTIFVSRTTM